uniref:DUF4410 domain-containing protein n=1 Tax=Candidatus Kentrum sp. LFY TaxID=2126342 RepID=A0A450URX7_9GAMM|nr:MAG: hypothetical protein BECKLFY1418A_GA0070994_104825 [Candidatus Kentron sp. LFY]
MKTMLLTILLCCIAGCGTAKTVVLDAPQIHDRYASISIIARNPTVDVPSNVTTIFEGELRKRLYDSNLFSRGTKLNLIYTFISHDEGNRFARWFWGGIGNSGEGSVTVMVQYLGENETELAKTQVEGRIGSGFFGGSLNDAIKKSAQDIAEYTINNFRK